MIKADELVLKTDKLGRMQTPTARRESLLDEFERAVETGETGQRRSRFAHRDLGFVWEHGFYGVEDGLDAEFFHAPDVKRAAGLPMGFWFGVMAEEAGDIAEDPGGA